MIPSELKEIERWIVWETGERGGKETKLPRAPWVGHAGNISATDPDNWTSYEEAQQWADMHPGYGLGFVFAAADDIIGVDLDDCIVEQDGEETIKPSARDICERCSSWTEYSPSGTGLHILVRGELDDVLKNDDRGVEVYDEDRFFTVTGDSLNEYPPQVMDAQNAVDFIMDEYMVVGVEEVVDLFRQEYVAGGSIDEGIEALREGRQNGESAACEIIEVVGSELVGEPDQSGVEAYLRSAVDQATSLPGEDAGGGPTGDAHALYDLAVGDVYPTISAGDNVAHPVHGSSTDANFKLHDQNPTAICWRGEHEYGSGVGCTLSACHLLAMEGGGWTNCRRVRKQYGDNDEMAFEAWKEAYSRGLVSGNDPPYRAVRHIAEKHGLVGMDEGGKGAWAMFRAAARLIRSIHDIPIELD